MERSILLPIVNLQHTLQYGLFEKNLITWCEQFGCKESVFLDIGAHTGTYSLNLASHFKMVHAFEPQRMTYYALCGGVALSNYNNVYCHQFGLGSEEQAGQATLQIISVDGGGSSLHHNPETDHILGNETIEIKTLDSLHIDSVKFIKMDIEGNEASCLKGAVETLKRSGYPKILFEANAEIKFEQLNKDAFDILTELGYHTVKIGGVLNMYLAEK